MPDITFPGFGGGEIGPSAYGQTADEAYYLSVKEARNFIISQVGAAIGRGGSKFVQPVKDAAKRALLVKFQFNASQAYMVELGDYYARFYLNREQIHETAVNVTGVSQASPGVVTANHNFARGTTVLFKGVGGMAELNGNYYKTDHILGAAATITAITKADTALVTFSGGHGLQGTEKVFIENVVGMTEVNDRSFQLDPFLTSELAMSGATQTNPIVISVAGSHGLSDGDEILTRDVVGMSEINDRRFTVAEHLSGAVNVSAATKANPCVVTTSSDHGFEKGNTIRLVDLGGMTELNDRDFTMDWSLQSAKAILGSASTSGGNQLFYSNSPHGYSTGDLIYFASMAYATQAIGRAYQITVLDAATFYIEPPFSSFGHGPAYGGSFVSVYGTTYVESGSVQRVDKNKIVLSGENSSAYGTFTSGGTASLNHADKFELSGEDGTGYAAYVNGGTVSAVDANTFKLRGENSITHSAYASGGTAKPLDTTQFKLQDLSGNDLDTQGFAPFTTGGTVEAVFEIETPYSADDLFDENGLPLIHAWQSADYLFLAHPSYHPQELTRTAEKVFSIRDFSVVGGPLLDENAGAVTIYADGAAGVGGTVDLVASAPVWQSGHVGALWQLRVRDDATALIWQTNTAYTLGQEVVNNGVFYRCVDAGTSGTEAPTHNIGDAYDGGSQSTNCAWRYIHNGRGLVRITSFTSEGEVQGLVISELPALVVGSDNATPNWSEGSWSDVRGYPRSVSIIEGRLVLGGNAGDPLSLEFSNSQSLFNHAPVDADGNVTQSTAFRRSLSSNSPIQWMVATDKGLVVGTLGGEWLVSRASASSGFGSTNANADPLGGSSSAAIQPVVNGDAILYVQRARKSTRDMAYSYNDQKLVSSDRNLRADHIAIAGIVATAFQEVPWRVKWHLLGDGTLAGLTYNREANAQISAWHKSGLGGPGAFIESVASIPSPDEATVDVWMIVRRTVNGQTVRYIEYLTRPLDLNDDIADGVYPDCAGVYDGAPATEIAIAPHLPNETARIFADGLDLGDMTLDANGKVTLGTAASKVVGGYYANRVLDTVNIEGGPTSKINTKPLLKSVKSALVEFVKSFGGYVGTDADHMDRIGAFDDYVDANDKPTRVTGLLEETVNDDSKRGRSLRYEQREAYPAMIASITGRFDLSSD